MNKHFDGLTAEITFKKEVDEYILIGIKQGEEHITFHMQRDCDGEGMLQMTIRLMATIISGLQKMRMSQDGLDEIVRFITEGAFAMAEEDRKNDLQERMENGEVKL